MGDTRSNYHGAREGLADPANKAVLLAKDGNDFADGATKFCRVKTAGTLIVKGSADSAVVDWGSVEAGETLWFQAIAIDAASTAELIGFY